MIVSPIPVDISFGVSPRGPIGVVQCGRASALQDLVADAIPHRVTEQVPLPQVDPARTIAA